MAELSDSSLLLNARDLSSIAGGGPTRLLQRSADGGASWSEPWRSPSLVQPASHRGCHGSMAAAAGGKSTLTLTLILTLILILTLTLALALALTLALALPLPLPLTLCRTSPASRTRARRASCFTT